MSTPAFHSPFWLLGLSRTPSTALLIYAQRVIVGVAGEALAFSPTTGSAGDRLARSAVAGLTLPKQAASVVAGDTAAKRSLAVGAGVIAYG